MTSLPHLILLPGLLCDAELWRDQVAALRTLATCEVADLTRGRSFGELADAVLGRAPPSFALAGFSFGGYVAQEILRRDPGRVERLALLDTSFRAHVPERPAAGTPSVDTPGVHVRFEGISGRLLRSFVHPDRLEDAPLVERIKSMTRRVGQDVFLRQSTMPRPDGAAVLKSLACPTLVLCGRQDVLTPPDLHEEMTAMIPRASLVVVEHCGHMSPMERPEPVAEALRAWLR